jgi:ABC-2 type transport system permease protein
VRSQGQLSAAADIGALAVTCLSGSLVPLPILPHWVAQVAPWTPGYWALHGFQAAVEGDAATVDRALAVLIAITILAFALAAAGVRPRRSPARQRAR